MLADNSVGGGLQAQPRSFKLQKDINTESGPTEFTDWAVPIYEPFFLCTNNFVNYTAVILASVCKISLS
jgi:hypothetical protein